MGEFSGSRYEGHMPESAAYSYLPPREVAANLWELHGTWSNKFGRRMTVIRFGGGKIAVHNAFALLDRELAWLKSLGEISCIIAPNVFHTSDAGWLAKQFPKAALFVPAAKLEAFRKEGFSPLDVNKDFPSTPELTCIPMLGTRIQEAAFLHAPSKTLLLCDLAFNMADQFTGLERAFMRWNKVGGRFGPSRLTRLLFTKNRSELLASYRKLLSLDFDRVIVNHGDVLQLGGKLLLQESVHEIFGA